MYYRVRVFLWLVFITSGQTSVNQAVMTGDHPNAANTIAGELGISDVHANCLPEDKLNDINGYQEKGEAVCMIGDGVNDAPCPKSCGCRYCHGWCRQ